MKVTLIQATPNPIETIAQIASICYDSDPANPMGLVKHLYRNGHHSVFEHIYFTFKIEGISRACSMLYGACCRIAKEMGYKLIITYILKSENGASLKASNFTCDGVAGGTHWTGKRNRGQEIPHEMKTRWHRHLC